MLAIVSTAAAVVVVRAEGGGVLWVSVQPLCIYVIWWCVKKQKHVKGE